MIEVLAICSECKAIRLDDAGKVWLKKEDDENLYTKKYEGKLSYSYCPTCYKKVMEEVGKL